MITKWARLFTENSGPVIVSGIVASVHPDLPEKDLDDLVANFNASVHEPPVTIGHPKDNSPAMGWVLNLVKKGKDLIAEMALLPEFAELVKKKVYKKRSIAYYTNFEGTGKKVLRHIGFLGGMPPRIKGMPDLVFAEFADAGGEFSEDKVGEFSEVELRAISHLLWLMKESSVTFRNIKNTYIEDKGAEAAEKIISEWFLKALERDIDLTPENDGLTMPRFKETQKEEKNEMELTQAQLDALLQSALDKQKRDLEAQYKGTFDEKDTVIKSLQAEVGDLKKSTETFAEQAARSEAEAFCETMIRSDKPKMAPAEKADFVKLYMEMTPEARLLYKGSIEKRRPVLSTGEEQTTPTGDQTQGQGQKGLSKKYSEAFGITPEDEKKYGEMETLNPLHFKTVTSGK